MAPSKVCAVFGYGPGLGAAMARKWSKEGFQVAIMSRSLDKVKVCRVGYCRLLSNNTMVDFRSTGTRRSDH